MATPSEQTLDHPRQNSNSISNASLISLTSVGVVMETRDNLIAFCSNSCPTFSLFRLWLDRKTKPLSCRMNLIQCGSLSMFRFICVILELSRCYDDIRYCSLSLIIRVCFAHKGNWDKAPWRVANLRSQVQKNVCNPIKGNKNIITPSFIFRPARPTELDAFYAQGNLLS